MESDPIALAIDREATQTASIQSVPPNSALRFLGTVPTTLPTSGSCFLTYAICKPPI